MKNDRHFRILKSLFILAATVLFIIALSVCGTLFFSLLQWFLGDGFHINWQDIVHGAKIGFYGGGIGGIGGIGLALLHFFKVKGF